MRLTPKGPWLTLIVLYLHFGSASWWNLSRHNVSTPGNVRALCPLTPNLDKIQRRMCRRRSDLMLTLGSSTREAILECQLQFKFHRWNCSTLERDSSIFGKRFIKGGTPELAFVQALTVASAVISVSRACSSGGVSCGCALNTMEESAFTTEDFKTSGCTESSKFALNFVRRFTDAPERERRDPKARMLLYNNRAGRVGLMEGSSIRCKCHGVSGSCALRSCWRFLPSLRAMGIFLKDKYEGAVKVDFDPKGHMLTFDPRQKMPEVTSLVYFEDTPNGCVLDVSRGMFGIGGRTCNATSEDIDSCDMVCCGHGHVTSRVSISYQCDCHFQWCCEVKCKECHEWQAVSHCRDLPESDEYVHDPVAVSPYEGYLNVRVKGHGVNDLPNAPSHVTSRGTKERVVRIRKQ